LKRSSRAVARRRGPALPVGERKKVEKPLRENEERFRELADLLPQIVFKIQANGKIEFLNREGLRYLG
jgi:PAS domain-containing protein